MYQLKKGMLAAALAGMVAFTPAYIAEQSPVMTVYAHGHHENHHSDSNTTYYYCNGHNAHTHANGVCPYANATTSNTKYYHCNGHPSHKHYKGACPYGNASKRTVKKVQRRLNRRGYSCGTADGVIGSRTRRALKKFQKDNGLKVDGILRAKTLKALGLKKKKIS